MSLLKLPFQLNSTGTGIETVSNKVDYLSMALLAFFNIKRMERPMQPEGSLVDLFVFENNVIVEETLLAYLNDFTTKYFSNLTIRNFSVYNENTGTLYIKVDFYDRETKEIVTSSIPLI